MNCCKRRCYCFVLSLSLRLILFHWQYRLFLRGLGRKQVKSNYASRRVTKQFVCFHSHNCYFYINVEFLKTIPTIHTVKKPFGFTYVKVLLVHYRKPFVVRIHTQQYVLFASSKFIAHISVPYVLKFIKQIIASYICMALETLVVSCIVSFVV